MPVLSDSSCTCDDGSGGSGNHDVDGGSGIPWPYTAYLEEKSRREAMDGERVKEEHVETVVTYRDTSNMLKEILVALGDSDIATVPDRKSRRSRSRRSKSRPNDSRRSKSHRQQAPGSKSRRGKSRQSSSRRGKSHRQQAPESRSRRSRSRRRKSCRSRSRHGKSRRGDAKESEMNATMIIKDTLGDDLSMTDFFKMHGARIWRNLAT